MAKIFDVNSDIHESPNRNTFDLTHKRHLTGKAGVIYPFLCQPVVPTDSFEIDTAIGANLMPMWYPTQSNMRFIVHYFFVPNRIMHKGWKNQLEGLEPENFPYMDVPAPYYKTSSLADFLGIPTTYVLPDNEMLKYRTNVRGQSEYVFLTTGNIGPFALLINDFAGVDNTLLNVNYCTLWNQSKLHPLLSSSSYVQMPFAFKSEYRYAVTVQVFDGDGLFKDGVWSTVPTGSVSVINLPPDSVKYRLRMGFGDYTVHNVDRHALIPVDHIAFNAGIGDCKFPMLNVQVEVYNVNDSDGRSTIRSFTPSVYLDIRGNSVSYYSPKGTLVDISDNSEYCPYYSTNNTEDTVKISALPFRAYDMVYNSYYRNWQGVQPFVVDGQTKYNEYLITDASGADSHWYELHTRNWELDAYTSCLPSPQQGDAPIIAVDSLGRMRIQDEDGTTSTLELRDLQGEQGIEVKNVDIQNPDHARIAMRMATSGLTIADFRQGNALQRFLEQSLRSGYRYADFIFGHFGKAPTHQELDMPIFLGGYTQNIDVSKISNVSASGSAPLGEFAGVGASFGGAKHNIKHYFDDYGYVLGVMMLVPDPAYSQILPKHFTYSSRLDYYFPQFSQLGMQPITYEELCPIQSHAQHLQDSSKLLTDTFGYQRPNHEYVWIPDTVHGLFRNSLSGSVVNRRFGSRPVLGDNFLKIKPEEVNDLFSVTEENDDIFIAQVVVDIKATRPIPRVVVPSLGR